MRRGWWLAMLACPVAAMAATPDEAVREGWLPGEAQVEQAIDRSLALRQARNGIVLATARQKAYQVGSYEPMLQFVPERRNVGASNPGQAGSYNDWEVDLIRSFRWPVKARLDREIGADGRRAAELMADDAAHEAARQLLTLWCDWLRSRVRLQQSRQALTSWQHEARLLARRIHLGDAAARDGLTIATAVAQANAGAVQAELAEIRSRESLQSMFPDLSLPTAELTSEPRPQALPGTDQGWLAQTLLRQHEIAIAQALADQKQAQASRAHADRLPDLSIGIRALSDYGGQEKAYGLVLGLPLGIRYRSAQAAEADAQAGDAAMTVEQVRRDLLRDTRLNIAEARGRYSIWLAQQQAAQAAGLGLAKAERAYQLGESGLTDLLASRRVDDDIRLASRLAAVDAIQAVTRVEVDAHVRWHRQDADDVAGGAEIPTRMGPLAVDKALQAPDLGD